MSTPASRDPLHGVTLERLVTEFGDAQARFDRDGYAVVPFLPPFEMRKAMHGDRVLASVTTSPSRDKISSTLQTVDM